MPAALPSEAATDRRASARARNPRARTMRWLRKTHGWIGLWGAALGLFFGATGLLLNHRAILPLPLPLQDFEQRTLQIGMPAPAEHPDQVVALLQDRLGLADTTPRVSVEPARQLQWAYQAITQPQRWEIVLESPQRVITAEYLRGNRSVAVNVIDANLLGTLTRFHRASGMNAVWVLIADSIAATLITLSITGLLLWSKMRSWRLLSIGVVSSAAIGALSSALLAL
jgi:hypothetical protein